MFYSNFQPSHSGDFSDISTRKPGASCTVFVADILQRISVLIELELTFSALWQHWRCRTKSVCRPHRSNTPAHHRRRPRDLNRGHHTTTAPTDRAGRAGRDYLMRGEGSATLYLRSRWIKYEAIAGIYTIYMEGLVWGGGTY